MDPPTERTSVRVILLDAADRVLLLGARDPDDGRTVWFMPGGGVEPGESFTQTADRKLREELGVSGLAFTVPVWTPATTTTPGTGGPSGKQSGTSSREHRRHSRPSASGRRGPRATTS